ncbi:MAG: hypothetical protein ABII00_02535 [Elusimicrobiota bacterium]
MNAHELVKRLRPGLWALFAAACVAGAPDAAAAPADEAGYCLACHGIEDFQTERDGKPRSLFIDRSGFQKTVHANISCVACHADLDGAELPHADRLAPARCGACHAGQEEKFADSLHGKALARGDKLAPRCSSCHGAHDILPIKHPESALSPLRIPFVCGSCHSEGAPAQRQREIHQHNILKNYSLSIHGEGLLRKGLSVSANCASCHTAHQILPHTDARSSISHGNIAKTCTQCHTQIETVHRKVIRGELWQTKPHTIPVCVECHQPHKVRKVFYDQGMADRDCLSCHAREGVRRASDGKSLRVEAAKIGRSVHGKTACAQCHTGASPSKRRPCETVTGKVDCSVCHSSQVEQYRKSTHGGLFARKDPNAPTCVECHGDHGVLGKKDHASPTFPINVPALCARCHREGKQAAVRYRGEQHEIPKNYVESIHGKGLLKSGLVVAATCTSCHTSHGELPASDPASSVHEDNIARTCSGCHHVVYEKYAVSVHSPLVTKTDKKLPRCNTCHTAHTIKRTDKGGFKLEIMDRCGKCHLDVAKTYFDTYHGKVSQLGYDKTAKCHDCHGAHALFSVDDPRSRLSRRNITETCRKCHPGATKRFAGYLTHSTHHDPHKYPLIFWTFWLMTSLLVGTFTVFGIHTLLWLPRSLQMRRAHPPEPYQPDKKQVQRFTPLSRVLHILMIVSFMTLAVTGMTLKFSYTRWAAVLSHILGGFETAGYLHRAAALLMLGIFFTHLWDVLTRKRRECGGWKALLIGPDTMLFTKRDLSEFVSTIKWYLGLGTRPDYGRWTYWEKFDYFAVFWGIAIIGSTGLALWFPELITRFLPGWIINLATIIHSDEALLATGFIFTIHFFNTHFRPEKFPMDITVFTGRTSLEELQRERRGEYDRLAASGELDRSLVDPLPPGWIKAARVFGAAALAVGLALVAGIIYAILFAYR